jgi:hypothetical protein
MSSPAGTPVVGVRLAQWLVWWQALLAFSGYITAAGVLYTIASPRMAALCLAINGGLNQATGVIISQMVPSAIRRAGSEPP